MITTLAALGEHESVWSFIRLPSSTSVLIQILLSNSLLNTSILKDKFKFEKANIVDTLAYALTTPGVLNAFNDRPDIAELTQEYIRRSPTELKTGFKPTWLVEAITRGDYGKALFALKNEIDHYPSVASAAHEGTGDTVKDVLRHYSKALGDGAFFAPHGNKNERSRGYPLDVHLRNLTWPGGHSDYPDSEGVPISKGDTIFEIKSKSKGSKLIRGDYEITPSGQVRITTDEYIDKNIWTQIYLPIDETLVGDTFDAHEEVRVSLIDLFPGFNSQYLAFYVNGDKLFSRFPRKMSIRTIESSLDLGFGHKHTWSNAQEIEWAEW